MPLHVESSITLKGEDSISLCDDIQNANYVKQIN